MQRKLKVYCIDFIIAVLVGGIVHLIPLLFMSCFYSLNASIIVIFIAITVYLIELTRQKTSNRTELRVSNKYIFFILLIILGVTFFIEVFLFERTVKSVLYSCFISIILYFLLSVGAVFTINYEIKIKKKKYHSIFMESRFWVKCSENFKWNYADLRKVFYRGTVIVLLTAIYYFIIISRSDWQLNVLIVSGILYGLALYNLEYQAMVDRKDDISIFKLRNYSDFKIIKLLLTQFTWMIIRGMCIGMVIYLVVNLINNENILPVIKYLVISGVFVICLAYIGLTLAAKIYLLINHK